VLVPSHQQVLAPHLEAILRRAVDVMYAWCPSMGIEQEGSSSTHSCTRPTECFFQNEVLGQRWMEWARKDAQGVTVERWRHIRTWEVFGHFVQSEKWELMWKSDLLDADSFHPPSSLIGLQTEALLLQIVWYWPLKVPGVEVAFEGISDRVRENIRLVMEGLV